MAQETTITYQFKFSDGATRALTVRLGTPDMTLVVEPSADEPDWIKLEFHQCPNCTFNSAEHRDCPVARGLAPVNDAFYDRVSYEVVDVVVRDAARSYMKTCPLQEAVSSLMGLIMATSGCPHLDKLRPMVLTHLPFTTAKQAFYRVTSMYLLAQFFRERRGQTPDWRMRDLARAFEEIREVNSAFARRLRESQTEDANLNAIVKLDCQADMASFLIEVEQWDDFENLFQSYFAEQSAAVAGS